MKFYFKRLYAMNSREFKNEKLSAVFYGPPLFSIQTYGKNIKKKNKKIYKLDMDFQRDNHEFLLQ